MIVEGNMKIGNFKLSYTDLSIPVAGIPITVSRSYDTLAKDSANDFGRGWALQIANVRLQKSVPVDQEWEERGTFISPLIGKRFDFRQSKKHIITITFLNGQVMKFAAAYKPQYQFLYPIENARLDWVPIGNTRGSLKPVDPNDNDPAKNNVFVLPLDNGSYDYPEEWSPVFLSGYGDNDDPAFTIGYNPDLWELTSLDGTIMHISERDGLVYVREPNGNEITIDKNGIHSSRGIQVDFTRDSQDRITAIRDPKGNLLKYQIDGNGDLTGVTNRENATMAFLYDSFHSLTHVIDASGNSVLLNEYDPETERLDKTHDAFGRATDFTHGIDDADIPDNIEIVTDRLGNKIAYGFNSRGNVTQATRYVKQANGAERAITTISTYSDSVNPDKPTSVTDALNRTTFFTYDVNGYPTSVTDARNHTKTATFDSAGRSLTITDALGHTITNTYDSNGSLVVRTDARGKETHFVYNDQGLLQSFTDAGNLTRSYTYNSAGLKETETDPLGNVTTYAYDANNQELSEESLWTETDPDALYTRLTRGIVTASKSLFALSQSAPLNPSGGAVRLLRTSWERDNEGHVTKVTRRDGSTVQTVYDVNGRVKQNIDPLNRITSYDYDLQGNLIATHYPDGNVARRSYDQEGRVYQILDPRGLITENIYDTLGHLVSLRHRDNTRQSTDGLPLLLDETTTSYDDAGQMVTTTNAKGFTTTYGYAKYRTKLSIRHSNQSWKRKAS